VAYPTKNNQRANYWLRKIDFSTAVLEPFFEVKKRIELLYENEAATLRAQALDGSSLGNENIARTKPSHTFAWVDQSIANLLHRDPKFRVRPKKLGSIKGANTVSNVVNYWMEETNQKKHDKRVLLDAYLGPFGVKKEGWESSGAEETLSDFSDLVIDEPEEEGLLLATGQITKVTPEQDHTGHNKEHQLLLDDPGIEDDIKENVIALHMDEHDAIQNQESSEPSSDVKIDQPWGLWVKSEDFRFDPLADDVPHNCTWIAFRCVRTLEQVKSNPNYKKSALKDLQPTTRPAGAPDRDPTLSPTEADDDFGLVVLWEIWAKGFPIPPGRKRDLLIVVAEQGAARDGRSTGEGVILRHDDEWPYKRLRGYPCRVLSFLKSPKQWLQKPILALAGADNMQLLSDEMRDSWLSVMRKQKNMLVYDSDIIDPDMMDLGMKSSDDLAIAVPGLRQGAGAIQAVPWPQISSEKMNFIAQAKQEFFEAAGAPSGAGAEDNDTATEAAIRERRTTAREAMRSDELEQYQIGTAEDFWALHTQFRPKEEILIDPNTEEVAEVTSEMVQGQYRFDIDISSVSTALAVEKKQWLDLLNLLSGMVEISMAAGMAPPNLPKIAEQLLIRGYEIPNPEEFWPAINQAQQGDPAALQAMTAEANIPNGSMGGPAAPQQFNEPLPNEAAIMGEAQAM
jgi:hypothetical protein